MDAKAALKPVTEGIWQVTDELTTVGIRFPLRMTVVDLGGGELLLHSPVRIDDAVAGQLAELGRVAHVVAPSCLHHVHAAAAQARYPDALLHGAPGLSAKRADIAFDRTLGPVADAAWREVLEQRVIDGCPKINEVVFLHRPSATLILTDLVFNMLEPRGVITQLMMRLVGAHKRLAQSRLWRRFTKDRTAARESVEAMLRWDFDRVVMCHGAIVDDDAKARLSAALWWMRGLDKVAGRAALVA